VGATIGRREAPVNDPQRFARDWITAWSRRDVDAVLAHDAESAVLAFYGVAG
jgi:ketosteroid isomerase-like protein